MSKVHCKLEFGVKYSQTPLPLPTSVVVPATLFVVIYYQSVDCNIWWMSDILYRSLCKLSTSYDCKNDLRKTQSIGPPCFFHSEPHNIGSSNRCVYLQEEQ